VAYTYAGQYGPDVVVNSAGAPQVEAQVTVYLTDGTTKATLYTDRTKVTTTANPVVTDALGNLTFWAEPGRYVLAVLVGTTTRTFNVSVLPDPAELSTDLLTVDGGAP
jgi:hypothetical protein